ncbi:MAG: hypothetical protein ACI4PH_01710 [Faecousia sp.]
MKKVLCVLLVILLIFALAAAGGYAYAWYRSNHIFVEDAVYPIDAQSLDLRGQEISFDHYNEVRSLLPDCEILWDVPFQGGKYANDTESLTVSGFSDEDMEILLTYFPRLKRLDASGCREYDRLIAFQEQRPQCQVIYQVDLGGKAFALDTTELTLENGDYDYDTLMENLSYLPQVTTITLRMPEISLDQVEQLKEAYENIAFSCTVELLGQEYDTQTTALDLSALTSDRVAETAEKLAMLPNLETVELMDADGQSALTKEDVKLLTAAAPEAAFHYTFDFYGVTISTDDEEVVLTGQKIGDEGEAEIRAALDLLTNCKRFVLDNCQVSNEVMAQIREDYRDRTKVVWRVYFGKGSSLTDAQLIRVVGDLVDSNCSDLIYCEDVVCIDLGHNEWLTDTSFIAGMVNLEYCIISGAPIKDLTPFANCKKLKFLEIAFCEYLTDATPLAQCESLEMLNISNTHITDLTPLDDLPLTHLCAKVNPVGVSRVPKEEQDRFVAQHPDCWATFTGEQPYGPGWRYDEDGITPLPYYQQIRDWLLYDIYPRTPNHTGWYFDTYADKT